MIDAFKKTFVIGMLVILCFLVVILMIKQFLMDEELATCRDKIQFLEQDMRSLYVPRRKDVKSLPNAKTNETIDEKAMKKIDPSDRDEIIEHEDEDYSNEGIE